MKTLRIMMVVFNCVLLLAAAINCMIGNSLFHGLETPTMTLITLNIVGMTMTE